MRIVSTHLLKLKFFYSVFWQILMLLIKNYNAFTPLHLNMLSPILRRWYSLCITGQSSFFFYGVHRNEQVPWLHPPSRTMIWSAVQTICQRNRSIPSIKTGMKFLNEATTIPNYFGQKPGCLGLTGRMSCIMANVSVLFISQRMYHYAMMPFLTLWNFHIVCILSAVLFLAPLLQRRPNCFPFC